MRQELVTGWGRAVKEKEIIVPPALSVQTDEYIINQRTEQAYMKSSSVLSQLG